MIRLDLSGFEQLAAMLDPAAMLKRVEDAHRARAQDLRAKLLALTPVSSGDLAASWSVDVEGVDLVVTNTAPYAGFVRGGELEREAVAVVAEHAQSTWEMAVIPQE